MLQAFDALNPHPANPFENFTGKLFDPFCFLWFFAPFVAIRSLSPEHRAVIVLRYLLEYTPGEIAKLLDLPRGTVNSRLRRGLDRLKELP